MPQGRVFLNPSCPYLLAQPASYPVKAVLDVELGEWGQLKINSGDQRRHLRLGGFKIVLHVHVVTQLVTQDALADVFLQPLVGMPQTHCDESISLS